MDEEKKTGLADAVETGASAAHTIKGAIKAGKAISSAAKGAAAGGPYGAVAGAVWAGRKHIGKIIAVIIILLLLPVLFVLMLPGLIFGGLVSAAASTVTTCRDRQNACSTQSGIPYIDLSRKVFSCQQDIPYGTFSTYALHASHHHGYH